MRLPLKQWNPSNQTKIVAVSGATSGATFAVTGVAAADLPMMGIVMDGAAATFKSVIQPGDITFTADAVQTTTDTSADKVILVYVDLSAG